MIHSLYHITSENTQENMKKNCNKNSGRRSTKGFAKYHDDVTISSSLMKSFSSDSQTL